MRVFERLRDWWRGPEVSADTSPFFVSNDELVTAYEWVHENPLTYALLMRSPTSEDGWALLIRPKTIEATLRKMEAWL